MIEWPSVPENMQGQRDNVKGNNYAYRNAANNCEKLIAKPNPSVA